jgi:ATP-binding cassette subfamily C protein
MAILTLGGWKVIRGQMTIGELVAFQVLMFSFQGPVSMLVRLGGELQTLAGDMLRVDDVMNHGVDPEVDRPRVAVDDSSGWRLEGHIELIGVTFGYSHMAPPLIEDFSLVIRPGQRVALIGGSGSGKSTIAKLVSGLYQPWAG